MIDGSDEEERKRMYKEEGKEKERAKRRDVW